MTIQKSKGIVLRRQDLRETSISLTFYTKDFGKIRGIVRGARGPRAQFAGGSFEIFACDEVVFYERKRSDFYTISQCDLIEFFNPIRGSLERLAYASYMVELLDSVTSLADKNAGVYDVLSNCLCLLSGNCSAKRVARIFEIKLLHLLGLMPTLEFCVHCTGPAGAMNRFSMRLGGLLCKNCFSADKDAVGIMPGTVNFIEHIRSSAFERVARVKVAARVGEELEGILRRFLDYHIERRMNTVSFIREVEGS